MRYITEYSHWSETNIPMVEMKNIFQEMVDDGIEVDLYQYNGEPANYKSGKAINLNSDVDDKFLIPYKYYEIVCQADDGNYDKLLSLLDSTIETGSILNPNNKIYKKLEMLGMSVRKFSFVHDVKRAKVEFRYFK